MTGCRRVLVIFSSDRLSGPARQVLQLFEYMDPLRYDLTFACTWLVSKPYPDLFVEVERRGFPLLILRQRHPFDPTPVYTAYRFIREKKIDIIQTHSYKPNIIGAVLARSFHLPWIVFVHGDTTENRKVMLYHALGHRVTHRADRIITVSRAVGDKVVAGGMRREKVKVIHNAIDPRDFTASVPPSAVRDRYGAGADERLIAVIGRFSSEKGQVYFVEALARLARSRPEVKAILVGEGPDEEMLRGRCRELGLGERVIFAGYQQDISQFYRAADLVVIPSLSEGLPNVALEALLHRRPIVATRVGGTPEVVIDGETGILVPPADPDSLAMAMAQFLDDPALRQRFADNGSRLIREEYSPRAKAERVAAVYDELLAVRKC